MVPFINSFFGKTNAQPAAAKLENNDPTLVPQNVLENFDLLEVIVRKLDHVSMAQVASVSKIWRQAVPPAVLSHGKELNACMPSWPRQDISHQKSAPVCRPLPSIDDETHHTFPNPESLNRSRLQNLISTGSLKITFRPEGDDWILDTDAHLSLTLGGGFEYHLSSSQHDRQATWPYAAGWSADGTAFSFLEPSGQQTRLCWRSFEDNGCMSPTPASVIIPQKKINSFSVSPTQKYIATTDFQGHLFVYPRMAEHKLIGMVVAQNRTTCMKEATRPGIDAAWLGSPIICWASDESAIAVKDAKSMVAWRWPSMQLLWPAQ
jgi:hypothetical protein